MSDKIRMPPYVRILFLLFLLSWTVCAGLCEELSGRNHKLQQLLKTLEDTNSTKGRSYKATDKSFLSKPQQLTPVPVHPIMNSPYRTLPTSLSAIQASYPESKIHPDSSSIKSYQDFYRVFYGTPIGVDHMRKQYGPARLQQARAQFPEVNRDLNDVRQANLHMLRIRKLARCRVPIAQVVRVKDYYPDPSREYLPRCTVLHRCGDSSGCCDNDAFHCVPSAMQEVTLHFYTLTVGRNGMGSRDSSHIENLLFVNHTACHCQPINDLPRIQDTNHPLVGQNGLDDTSKSKCRDCPVPFTGRTYKDGRCSCDCFDKQKPCLRIKRGRDPLSDIERRCVEANHCHIPDCEYGLFDHSTGFCPKRYDEDKESNSPSHKSHHSNNNHRNPQSASHRWAFIERD